MRLAKILVSTYFPRFELLDLNFLGYIFPSFLNFWELQLTCLETLSKTLSFVKSEESTFQKGPSQLSELLKNF